MAEQRMLLAKMMGLEAIFKSSDPISEADRDHAQKLLRASAALVRHHNKSTKPAL